MAAELYVISGFLGAGKTTLIQKLLKEAFRNEKVVLIENDFGEISIDAALLKSSGVEVKEINAGCICCSLSGDFVKALKELLDRFRPDKIIIEPSGVGKLSDIIKACSDPRLKPLATVKCKITVADVKRCKLYLDNFGEFFEDQIKHADVVLLSRTETFPDKVDSAYKLVRELNAHSAIIAKAWSRITAAEILHPEHEHHKHHKHHGHGEHCSHGQGCSCGHHGAQVHGEHCSSGHHNHGAEDIFDTVTIRTKRIFSREDLKARVSKMEQGAKGTILRAKGIVRGTSGWVNLQYLPGDLKITKCAAGGDMLCFIGRNLNRQELVILFGGE
ncbi:CobW family GTP-binding protein [Desulfosporosinus youngiae]|uniref:Putative GTPase, G3E family n=1 Tax=Desulfosporosinus youngiae DSM 17734 TaxID=768710 RepID=H5XXC1_9FIRM|nr:GTP-binding protein [Desulfosporosinus youngiae]EHQ91127.1 putative GTPase, G3E family [Desulfosporosinus youngiae DSM 17734]